METNFHLSLPCLGIQRTKDFYGKLLGAKVGRNTNHWVDINLYGNQITFTKSGDFNFAYKNYKFENAILPSFHFGIVMSLKEWNELFASLQDKDVLFMDKTNFLQDKNGEHSSFFLKDPNGYIVEFKTFKDAKTIFMK